MTFNCFDIDNDIELFLYLILRLISECQATLEKEKADLERVKEENEARYEMQQSILNENLTAVRGDLTVASQKVDDLSRINDELRGEKLGMCRVKYRGGGSTTNCEGRS